MLTSNNTSNTSIGIWPRLYCLWATISICLAIAVAGLSDESITRILVIVFLLCQIPLRTVLVKALSWLSPKARFVVLGTLLAAVVEGFHMISKPVFLSLQITRNTSFMQGLTNYALDLIFTVPAYLVIFSVIWWFINRYEYKFWQYVFVMGLAQALGDGGIFFFITAPPMLLFLPYPMTNYHTINVIPFLAVEGNLSENRTSSHYSYLAIVGIIGTYLVCGAIIKLFGRAFGLEPN